MRGGAGLVELFVPKEIYDIVASAAPPEVMVKPISSYAALRDEPIDIWAIGPGLGRAHAAEIRELIALAPQPMVIDADALNVLAQDPTLAAPMRRPAPPHPASRRNETPLPG